MHTVNEHMQGLGTVRSVIRDLFEYGLKRASEVGAENVYDYSLGNPSTPAPASVEADMLDLIAHEDSVSLHGYTSAQGLYSVRKAVSDDIRTRFGAEVGPDDIYMTCGAAASLTVTLKAMVNPGDEVVAIAPFFPEYRVFSEAAGAVFRVAEADLGAFQINFDALSAVLNARTKAVIVNSPNNPSGVVFRRETVEKLCAMLKEREAEYGHPIFLISDEPYRELVYDGTEVPYLMNLYDDTVVCYSFSKSLSLPGERIGYIAVSPKIRENRALYAAVCGAGRALGYVCAPSMMQQVVAKNLGKTSDLSVYRTNRDLLYNALTEMGYEAVYPDGAFYLFVKSPEPDAKAFSERAKQLDLLLVPSDSFGCPGYVRLAYCVKTEMIRRSLPAFRKLIDSYREERNRMVKFSEMPYTRVDMGKVKDEMAALIANAKNARSGEELFENHRKYYKLTGEVETMWTIASIRHGIDTTDPFYEAEHDFYDEAGPLFQNLMQTYARTLYESPFRPYMEEKIGKVAFKNIEIALKSFDEKLIPMLQEENALTTRYMKLMANVKIEFNGETCNLTRMRVYQTHQDRSIRKAATKALSDYFLSVTDELDEIYDKLVKNRTAQARALGYENYVQLGYYRMGRNDYGRADVERFRKQVKESFVPFVSKINAARTARLGIFDPKFYDAGVFFNEGNPDPVGTPEEILESGRKMYHELSPETAEFIDFMLENELFDVLGRPNKQQGGYMTFLPVYKAPFIFANFNGTSADVDVITHECGHAFQGFLMRDEEIREYGDIGMETAEIHSMSMEYFTYGWMQSFFGDRYRDYLKMHFEDSCTFVPYGCMVDEFQHIVYENPDMTPAERKQVWAELEKSYRPDIDFDGDPFFGQGGYWQRQQHIFNSPFYYIDYVLASVCAMQFKVRMDEDFEGAWKTYLKLCRFAARDFYRNMLADAGLDSPFAEGTVEKLVNALETRL